MLASTVCVYGAYPESVDLQIHGNSSPVSSSPEFPYQLPDSVSLMGSVTRGIGLLLREFKRTPSCLQSGSDGQMRVALRAHGIHLVLRS